MDEKFVHILKALSGEMHFELVKLLLTHEFCVGALAQSLKLSEAAVSQHLKILREAGLVKGEKGGYWTHYMVEKERLNELAQFLREMTNLSPSPDGICIKTLDNKISCGKEGAKKCGSKCQYPEKLKGKPEECIPEQVKECHGEAKHPCEDEKK